MLDLATATSALTVAPEAGATITHFGPTSIAADNVLAAYDWASPLPASGRSDYGNSTDNWLSAYRGGWQLLAPNAGAETDFNGIRHPFHGEVSRTNWHADSSTPQAVQLSAATNGPLEITRRIELDDIETRVTVRTTLTNDTAAPGYAILVEHIGFNADHAGRLIAPNSSMWESEPGDPQHPSGTKWQDSDLAVPTPRGGSTLVSMTGGSEGWMEIDRVRRPRLRLEWDHAHLPFLWCWQERGSLGFPWFGRADVLGLEPSSARWFDGLQAAHQRGEAARIEPGGSLTVWVSVRIDNPADPIPEPH